MPPFKGTTWPSSDVPMPKGTIGHLCFAHIFTRAETSSVLFGKATASGMAGAE